MPYQSLEEDDQLEKKAWKDILSVNKPAKSETVIAVLPIKPVLAMVITQNCDATRGHSISLCEIEQLSHGEGEGQPSDDPEKVAEQDHGGTFGRSPASSIFRPMSPSESAREWQLISARSCGFIELTWRR